MSLQIITDYLDRTIGAYTVVTFSNTQKHHRTSIQHIMPFGYHAVKEGTIYILHRTHLIADQLLPEGLCDAGNIVTGTFFLNIKLMLPIENQIRKYVFDTKVSVSYSVEPLYHDTCKIPYAIHLSANSLDQERTLHIDTVLLNSQPGYTLDYRTGSCKKIKSKQVMICK